MQIGVVFPQTEIGADAGAVRAYGQRITELGFSHVLAYDHVIGADPVVHPRWQGPYDVRSTFHEPFVLFGFLAASTPLELVTGIIILPQRQTVLVAKQAAEVDLLSGGRFRLGVGLGWNAVEYEALGQDFTTRGRRIGEQVSLLRRLWTEPSLTFRGSYHQITGAGLAPLPVQRPIPVWFGASSEPAYRRVGRLADGWFPQVGPGPRLDAARAVVRGAAAEAGRNPGALGMEGRVSWRGSAEDLAAAARRWQQAGATHLSINTMGAGLRTVDDHLTVLAAAAAVLPMPGQFQRAAQRKDDDR
jgi:probable F420-dependent oxidoreductase